MRRVYIVNKGGHDFSGATKFGEVVYLSEGRLDKYALTEMYREFSEKLRDSGSDDFLLITSLASSCSVAAACFAFLHGRLNLLLFKEGKYIERKLKLDELLTKI